MRVRYLPYTFIDKRGWDACNEAAPNGSVYTRSDYLDVMSGHWDGMVVEGDPGYRYIMPLTWNRKWGIRYLFQAPLSAAGGVIGPGPISADLVRSFLEAIPGKFRYWEFPLNHGNRFVLPGYPFTMRMNYVLPLTGPCRENFSEHHQRNIRKAKGLGLKYGSCALEEVVRLARARPESDPGRDALARFVEWTAGRRECRAVFDEKGEALSAAAFLFSHGRAYYVLVGNRPEGRALGASHYLIDGFAGEFSGQGLTLDFEGSDVPGLASFYSGFGATEEPYPAVRLNRLPWWLRWAKRP